MNLSTPTILNLGFGFSRQSRNLLSKTIFTPETKKVNCVGWVGIFEEEI